MANLYVRRPIDFVFDFSSTNGSAGNEYRTGQGSDFYIDIDGQDLNEYELDNDSCMEIEGVEILGPYDGLYRQKLGGVRLIINGQSDDSVVFNEMNAPAYHGMTPNVVPEFRDGNVCTNLGVGMLASADPAAGYTTLKVGPLQDIVVAVTLPKAAEGGESSISAPMRVRLHTIEIKSEAKLQEVLTHYGHLDANGQVPQGFRIGDIENTENNPVKDIVKVCPNVAGEKFTMADWSALHGGLEADKPYIKPYVGYAQNAADTTANEYYDFTMVGSKVNYKWQELKWNLDKREAVKLTHLGVFSNPDAKFLRLYKSGRAKLPEYRITPDINSLPMPQDIYTDTLQYNGPARLGRGFWVWNEQASVQIKDNGTAVKAWAAKPTRGVMIGFWGMKVALRGDE